MDDWNLLINFAFPHERFRVGWEIQQPDDRDEYYTLTIDLFIVTFQLNWI